MLRFGRWTSWAVVALLVVSWAGCAQTHGSATDGGRSDASSRDAPASDAGPFCTATEVQGTGGCALLLGWFWTGRGCDTLSGCTCEGSDCDRLFDERAGCLAERGERCFGCAPMDVEMARPCGPTEDPAPRWRWDGEACERVLWCECAGSDCDRLLSDEQACTAAYRSCPGT